MKDIFVIIPTLDPNEKIMEEFILKLQKEFKNIIIVNDGCKDTYDEFFKKFEAKKIKVLRNNVNLGKGMALKHAYNYILNEYPKCKGVVSADCDGQHSVEDIKKCAEAVLANPDSLILGVRDFNKPDVPRRSKFGNKMTKFVMEELVDISISDTQTGLRGMSLDVTKKLIKTVGERYEYETKVLIDCKKQNINIVEVPIETIYIDGNADSHFDPFSDSLKIYKTFSGYFGKLILSVLINLIIFKLIYKIITLPSIITVTIAIIVANLITTRFVKLKETDIVNYIVYMTTLVVLTLIFGGITNISYTICYFISMILSYLALRVFFE